MDLLPGKSPQKFSNMKDTPIHTGQPTTGFPSEWSQMSQEPYTHRKLACQRCSET